MIARAAPGGRRLPFSRISRDLLRSPAPWRPAARAPGITSGYAPEPMVLRQANAQNTTGAAALEATTLGLGGL